MTRAQLVDAIAQTARDIDALHRDMQGREPTVDEQAWWDGLLARFADYARHLAALDAELAERLARLPTPP